LGIGGTTPAILNLAGGECSVSEPRRFTSFKTTPTPTEQEVVTNTSRLDAFENGQSPSLAYGRNGTGIPLSSTR
jgi:hypothetical protein